MCNDDSGTPQQSQPAFNLPGVVLALVSLIVAVHIASIVVLDDEGRAFLNLWFAFIPTRIWYFEQFPGGWLPLVWTPITHAFLHGSWEHLLLNSVWLAIFGTPVAQRYGAVSFVVVFLISAIAGAAVFAAFAVPDDLTIMVGASGGIAGLTGLAMRFIFQPLEVARHRDTGEIIAAGRRLASLPDLMRNVRSRSFILVWVALNAIMPILPMITGGGGAGIAWQAHLGGFFAGLFLAPLFEPKPPKPHQE